MTDGPCSSLPRPEYIGWAANRKRQQLRPKDPLDLDFELEDAHIPDGFFRSDVKVRGRRHLILSSCPEQRAGTSTVPPSIIAENHSPSSWPSTRSWNTKYEDHAKQVPLLFVLMSGRKKNDYCKVFKQLLEILPSVPAAKQITLDFERAVWATPGLKKWCHRPNWRDACFIGSRLYGERCDETSLKLTTTSDLI